MNTKLKFLTAVIMTILIVPCNTMAQKKFTVNGSVDLVSDYVWRGAYQNSGVSLQPSLSLSYYGVKLNVWGNQSLTKQAKEFDINLSYTYKNFSITVSDYWWAGTDMPYADYNSHFFEGTVAYTIHEKVPLTLSWSTMFAGGDKNDKGKLQASTYIQASYLVSLPYEISLIPSIGFTPWKGMYYDKTAVTDIALKASKNIKLSEMFNLPIFLQIVVAPMYNRTYLIGGVSVAF